MRKAVTHFGGVVQVEDICEPNLTGLQNSFQANVVCVVIDDWRRVL